MSNLVEELKRRNVIRVGIAYLVAAWVVLRRMQNELLRRERRSAWVRELTARAAVSPSVDSGRA